MMDQTIVYIDGFNLYYGAVKNTPHRWLDLEALAKKLQPKDNIVKIRYFTAIVTARPGDPQQPVRQQVYLRALDTLLLVSVHHGQFKETQTRMRLVNPRPKSAKTALVHKSEEKGSDVNLASYLLLDAFRKRCTTAVVISNDSDLKTPIEMAQQELGIKVGVVNPHPPHKRSRDLQPTFFKQLRASALASCQLPATLTDAQGNFGKPRAW